MRCRFTEDVPAARAALDKYRTRHYKQASSGEDRKKLGPGSRPKGRKIGESSSAVAVIGWSWRR
jgi:hypothetical protein